MFTPSFVRDGDPLCFASTTPCFWLRKLLLRVLPHGWCLIAGAIRQYPLCLTWADGFWSMPSCDGRRRGHERPGPSSGFTAQGDLRFRTPPMLVVYCRIFVDFWRLTRTTFGSRFKRDDSGKTLFPTCAAATAVACPTRMSVASWNRSLASGQSSQYVQPIQNERVPRYGC